MSGKLFNISFGDCSDPAKAGILRKGNWHLRREQLRANRRVNILHGSLIIIGILIFVYAVLIKAHQLQEAENNELTDISIDKTSFADLETEISTESDWFNYNFSVPLHAISEFLYNTTNWDETESNFYCKQPLYVNELFQELRKQVLNQNEALDALETFMRSSDSFKAIALAGPPGVGKSLTAQILRKQFPWPENVHEYSWSTYVSEELRKFYMVQQFVQQISGCGQNLLIIDNLVTCDYGFVSIFNTLIREREGNRIAAALSSNQSVLVVYIFNLEVANCCQQLEMLEQLPSDTTLVRFQMFDKTDVAACLRHELKQEGRCMSDQLIEELLNEIDTRETGCKLVRSIVFEHGVLLQ